MNLKSERVGAETRAACVLGILLHASSSLVQQAKSPLAAGAQEVLPWRAGLGLGKNPACTHTQPSFGMNQSKLGQPGGILLRSPHTQTAWWMHYIMYIVCCYGGKSFPSSRYTRLMQKTSYWNNIVSPMVLGVSHREKSVLLVAFHREVTWSRSPRKRLIGKVAYITLGKEEPQKNLII